MLGLIWACISSTDSLKRSTSPACTPCWHMERGVGDLDLQLPLLPPLSSLSLPPPLHDLYPCNPLLLHWRICIFPQLITCVWFSFQADRPALNVVIFPLLHEDLTEVIRDVPMRHLDEITLFKSRVAEEPPNLWWWLSQHGKDSQREHTNSFLLAWIPHLQLLATSLDAVQSF